MRPSGSYRVGRRTDTCDLPYTVPLVDYAVPILGYGVPLVDYAFVGLGYVVPLLGYMVLRSKVWRKLRSNLSWKERMCAVFVCMGADCLVGQRAVTKCIGIREYQLGSS